MQTLKEKLMKAKKEIEELKKVEEWKQLCSGFSYRRAGTDTELRVDYWTATELKSWTLLEIGQLPERL